MSDKSNKLAYRKKHNYKKTKKNCGEIHGCMYSPVHDNCVTGIRTDTLIDMISKSLNYVINYTDPSGKEILDNLAEIMVSFDNIEQLRDSYSDTLRELFVNDEVIELIYRVAE